MRRHLSIFLRRTYGGLPGVTWLICGAAFVNRAGAMVLPFLSLYLGKRYGYTVEDAGYVVGVYGIGAVVGSVFGGKLADRLGPVRTQIVTLTATALWMWALALVANPWLFTAGMFVLGAMNDAFRPGNVAAVAASCARFRQSKALALNRLALNAGWAIGPPIGGLLAQVDYRLLFVADGASCAGAALLLAMFVPIGLGKLGAEEVHGTAAAARTPPLSPWRDGRFLVLIGLSLLCFATFLQQFQTMSRHLEKVLGFDEGDIGLLLIINPALVVLLEMPLVHAMRHRAQMPIVVVGAVCVGVAYPFLIVQSWGTTAVVLSILVATAGEILYMPFLGAFVSERAPAAVRGNYLGAYFASFSAAFVVAPAAGGWIYDRLGADALWLTCLLGGLLSATGFWWLHRTDPVAGPGRG